MPIALSVIALAVIAGIVFLLQRGDDDGPAMSGLDKGNATASGDQAGARSSDELWKDSQNGVRAPELSGDEKKGARKRWDHSKKRVNKAEWMPYMSKVDMKAWEKIESIMAEARRLRHAALEARKTGDEKNFEKLITKAVKEWRRGDLLSEDFSFQVDGIKDGLWDAMFRKEQQMLENLVRQFRGFLAYENK